MYSFLQKYGTQAAFGFSSILILICVLVISSKSISYPIAYETALASEEVKTESKIEVKSQLAREKATNIVQQSEIAAVGPLLGLSEFLTIACILIALIFPLYLMKDDSKKLIKIGAVILVAMAIWFVFYAFSSSEVKGIETPYSLKDAKITGALIGIIVLGILGAIGALIWGEVNKLIKER